MEKLHTPHRALYRLLASLSILIMLTGQAAMPVPQTATPPTPAQDSYSDWSERRKPEPAHEESFEGNQPLFNLPKGTCSEYYGTQDNYTGITYSNVQFDKLHQVWNEDIYFLWGACAQAPEVRLTGELSAEFEPRLSKDALSIAFVSTRNSSQSVNYYNIYTMFNDGTNQQQVTSGPYHDRVPTFSPSGEKIAFASDRSGNAEIFTINRNGSGLAQLTSSAEVDTEPDWSPDGKQIIWVRQVSNTTGVLYVMGSDGTNQHALLGPLPYLGRPVWSPSGTRIAFRLDANNDGWYELAIVNADGSRLAILPNRKTKENSDLDMGGWMQDESALIYSETNYIYENQEWYIDGSAIYRVDLFSYNAPTLISFNRYNFTPSVHSLDDTPPVSTLSPLPEFSQANNNISLKWHISDKGSYPKDYTISSSSNLSPTWQNLFTGYLNQYLDSQTEYSGTTTFSGKAGTTAYFRIESTDWASNFEKKDISTVDTWTRFYDWKSQVAIADAREHQLTGVKIQASSVMNQPVTNNNGLADLYFFEKGTFAASYQKPGYAALAPYNWISNTQPNLNAILTGSDEKLQNGQFNDAKSPLAGWQSTGDILARTDTGRTGGLSARIGRQCVEIFCFGDHIELPPLNSEFKSTVIGVNDLGITHIAINTMDKYYYIVIDGDGNIKQWPDVPATGIITGIDFDKTGNPYLGTQERLFYWNGTGWDYESLPISAVKYTLNPFVIDEQGRVHYLIQHPGTFHNTLYYMRREPDKKWGVPIPVLEDNINTYNFTVQADGTAHIVYNRSNETSIKYVQVHPDLTVSQPITIGTLANVRRIELQINQDQGLTVTYSTGENWVSLQRSRSGVWSEDLVPINIGTILKMDQDSAGNIYVVTKKGWSTQYGDSVRYFSIKPAKKEAYYSYLFYDPYDMKLDVDNSGITHASYGFSSMSGNHAFYQQGVPAASPYVGAIDQTVSLPLQMNAPTLSFFYKITTANMGTLSRFRVTFTPVGEQPVIVLDREAQTIKDWTHVWADLSPFLGKTGSLSFRMEQAQGEIPAMVMIDEVSLSNWPTPILTQITPNRLLEPPYAGTWVDLAGENFQPGVKVYIDNIAITALVRISSTQMRLLVPDGLLMGTNRVRIINPGGAEAVGALYLGNPIFLTTITR